MRLKISVDWTAEPPGELIWIATALAPRMVNAFSIAEATVDSARPGLNGGELTPMAPARRSTGTRGRDFVQLAGSKDFNIFAKPLPLILSPYRRTHPDRGRVL